MAGSSTQSADVALKVKLRAEEGDAVVRRFSLQGQPTFEELQRVLGEVFHLPRPHLYRVTYVDEEGDVITMSSTPELHEAIALLKGDRSGLLRLELSPPTGEEAARLATPAAAPPGGVGGEAVQGAESDGKWRQMGAQSVPRGGPQKRGCRWGPERGGHSKWHSKEEKAQAKAQAKAAEREEREQRKLREKAAQRQLKEEEKEHWRLMRDGARACEGDASNRLHARFVRFPPGQGERVALEPFEPFAFEWVLRNEGKRAWPRGTALVLCKGSDGMGVPAGYQRLLTEQELAPPEQEVTLPVHLVAPPRPGHYAAHFRLAAPSGRKFGQRISALAAVRDPPPASQY